MGSDKALLGLSGEPLWQRQSRVLQAAGATAVGVVRQVGQPALELPPRIRLWHDTVVGAGPLAGLHAALAACQTEWLAVLATDMPRIDVDWFHWLYDYCRPGCGAMARHANGHFEPLAAIYPRAALPEVEHRLYAGRYALYSLAAALAANGLLASVPLRVGRSWRVANWNTPAEAGCESRPDNLSDRSLHVRSGRYSSFDEVFCVERRALELSNRESDGADETCSCDSTPTLATSFLPAQFHKRSLSFRRVWRHIPCGRSVSP